MGGNEIDFFDRIKFRKSRFRHLLFMKQEHDHHAPRLSSTELHLVKKHFLKHARKTGLLGAEDATIDALSRAIESFNPSIKRKCQKNVRELVAKVFDPITPRRSRALAPLFAWIRLHVNYAILNVRAKHPYSDVRDAVLGFRRTKGELPTLPELRWFSGLSTPQILNVWLKVAKELGISPAIDPILPFLDSFVLSSQASTHEECQWHGLVRRVLKKLKPVDASVLLLFYVCQYSEQQVVEFFRGLMNLQKLTRDKTIELFEDFAKANHTGMHAPWDDRLLRYSRIGPLRTALNRARMRALKIAQIEIGCSADLTAREKTNLEQRIHMAKCKKDSAAESMLSDEGQNQNRL